MHDVRVQAMTTLIEAGSDAAASPAELAEQCATVLVCVQTDDQCRAVPTGRRGVLAGISAGRCHLSGGLTALIGPGYDA